MDIIRGVCWLYRYQNGSWSVTKIGKWRNKNQKLTSAASVKNTGFFSAHTFVSVPFQARGFLKKEKIGLWGAGWWRPGC